MSVSCNGRFLAPGVFGSYSLDDFDNLEDKLVIEAKVQGQTICRHAFYVESHFVWPRLEINTWTNHLGTQGREDDLPRISGSLIHALESPNFSFWIPATPLVISTVEPARNFETPSPISGVESLEKVAPTVESMSALEIKEFLDLWKSELGSVVPTEYRAELNDRQMGAELTEGCLQYIAAVSRQDARSFSRAIKELRQAKNSEDSLISIVASALLQLAYFRSDRNEKVAEMRGIKLPAQFQKLEWFMNRMAGVDTGVSQPTGIGIEDVSPLSVDAALADALSSEAVSQESPEV